LANPDLANAEPSRELRLDNTEGNDGEYNSCPAVLLLNHYADGAADPALNSIDPSQCDTDGLDDALNDCPVRTYVTLVPCSQDFENQIPSRVKIQLQIFNEFEQEFSASTAVECWENINLGDITATQGVCAGTGAPSQGAGQGLVTCRDDADCRELDLGFCVKNGVLSVSVLGTTTAYTRLSPVDRDGGVVGIAEELHLNDEANEPDEEENELGSWAAFQLQQEGTRFEATAPTPDGPVVDTITIPEI
jgi:hypothetical protein